MKTLAYRLLLLMVFTLPWENVVDLPGVGRVSKAVGLLVAVVWFADLLVSKRVRSPSFFRMPTVSAPQCTKSAAPG